MNKEQMHQIFAHYIDNFERINNKEHEEYYKWQVCAEFKSLMDEALDANIINLQKQMEELKGAMKLSQKMKEDTVQLASMDVNVYWNTIEEEEKQGNQFIDIAKDIIEIEKGIFASYFSATDKDGKPYESFSRILLNVVVCTLLAGIIICLFEKNLSIQNFLRGIRGIASIIILEMVLSIPLYFLGKKFEWIRKNRKKALFIVALVLLVVLLILASALGI